MVLPSLRATMQVFTEWMRDKGTWGGIRLGGAEARCLACSWHSMSAPRWPYLKGASLGITLWDCFSFVNEEVDSCFKVQV